MGVLDPPNPLFWGRSVLQCGGDKGANITLMAELGSCSALARALCRSGHYIGHVHQALFFMTVTVRTCQGPEIAGSAVVL